MSVFRTKRVPRCVGCRCPKSAVERGGFQCAYQNASEVHGPVGRPFGKNHALFQISVPCSVFRCLETLVLQCGHFVA